MTFCNVRLREMVEATGLSQNAVAERCGVTSGQLSQFVNGHNVPNVENLCWLAEGLGVTPNDLLGIRRQPTSSEKHAAALLRQRIDAAIALLRGR